MSSEKGMIFVISAPSGAGKTTLIDMLREEYPELKYSISTTTRPKRDGEVDGVDYHFVDKTQFDEMVSNGDFLEWAQIHTNYYGTSKKAADSVLALGDKLLLDVDIQGGDSLRAYYGNRANFIYIVPPSMEELEKRLRLRKTETKETLKIRLGNAIKELKAIDRYDFIIVNDDLDTAYEELKIVFQACHFRTNLRQINI